MQTLRGAAGTSSNSCCHLLNPCLNSAVLLHCPSVLGLSRKRPTWWRWNVGCRQWLTKKNPVGSSLEIKSDLTNSTCLWDWITADTGKKNAEVFSLGAPSFPSLSLIPSRCWWVSGRHLCRNCQVTTKASTCTRQTTAALHWCWVAPRATSWGRDAVERFGDRLWITTVLPAAGVLAVFLLPAEMEITDARNGWKLPLMVTRDTEMGQGHKWMGEGRICREERTAAVPPPFEKIYRNCTDCDDASWRDCSNSFNRKFGPQHRILRGRSKGSYRKERLPSAILASIRFLSDSQGCVSQLKAERTKYNL